MSLFSPFLLNLNNCVFSVLEQNQLRGVIFFDLEAMRSSSVFSDSAHGKKAVFLDMTFTSGTYHP